MSWGPMMCVAVATLLLPPLASSQTIALTFDDGPNMADAIGLSPVDRNAAILSQLAEAHLKSILFVTRVDSDPKRNDLIRQWGIEGHQIGNHTATHPDFDEVSLADYERELLTCDKAIRDLPGFTRRFRFPYLKDLEADARSSIVTPSVQHGHAAPSAVTRDRFVSHWAHLAMVLRDHGFDQRVLRGGLNDSLQPKSG